MSAKRIAVVTGGNKGIGFGIVKELCSKFDGIVYLTARDEGRGMEAVKQLGELGHIPCFHQLDIDSMESINRFADYIKKTYGGFDVLVNNAAIAYEYTDSAIKSFGEQAENTIRVNVFGTMNLCRALFPLLRPGARVANVSSDDGHLTMIQGDEPAASALREKFASPTLTEEEIVSLADQYVKAAKACNWKEEGWPKHSYKVSKVSVSALTRVQQRAFDSDPRPDMVVNTCYPGYVPTDMTSHKGPHTMEQGVVSPVYLALLPPKTELRGAFVWYDKQVVDWTKGPTPPAF